MATAHPGRKQMFAGHALTMAQIREQAEDLRRQAVAILQVELQSRNARLELTDQLSLQAVFHQYNELARRAEVRADIDDIEYCLEIINRALGWMPLHAVADNIGCSSKSIKRWRSGRVTPHASTVRRLLPSLQTLEGRLAKLGLPEPLHRNPARRLARA